MKTTQAKHRTRPRARASSANSALKDPRVLASAHDLGEDSPFQRAASTPASAQLLKLLTRFDTANPVPCTLPCTLNTLIPTNVYRVPYTLSAPCTPPIPPPSPLPSQPK